MSFAQHPFCQLYPRVTNRKTCRSSGTLGPAGLTTQMKKQGSDGGGARVVVNYPRCSMAAEPDREQGLLVLSILPFPYCMGCIHSHHQRDNACFYQNYFRVHAFPTRTAVTLFPEAWKTASGHWATNNLLGPQFPIGKGEGCS